MAQPAAPMPPSPMPPLVAVPAVPTAPMPTQPAASPKPTAAKPAQAPWKPSPPLVIVALLVVLIVEMVGYGLLHPLWWAVANAVLMLAVLAVAYAVARAGGVRRLLGRISRRPVARRLLGARSGRAARPGSSLFGRRRSGAGSGSGPARAGGLRSRLPRAFGGRSRASTSTGGTATRPAGRSRLFGRGGTPGSSSPAGGSRRSRLFGGRGASSPGSSARSSRRARLFGGRRGTANPAGRMSRGTGARPGRRPAGRLGKTVRDIRDTKVPGRDFPDRTGRWRRRSAWEWLTGKPQQPAGRSSAPARKSTGQPAGVKPQPGPRSGQPPKPASPARPTPPPAAPTLRPPSGPRHATNPTRGGNTVGNHSSGDAAIPHVGDGSLQRWGKDLSGAAPAADHVKKLYARAEAAAQEWRDSFGRMTDRGENELPASAKVTAEMQALRTRSGGATSSGDWGSISADAEALPKVYEMEHETDEARLRQPRKSHEAEKRADVTVAAQDN